MKLDERAWSRVRSKNARIGEKASVWLVTNAMKLKRKLGMGIYLRRRKSKSGDGPSNRKRRVTRQKPKLLAFRNVVTPTREIVKGNGGSDIELAMANGAVRNVEDVRDMRIPCVISIPKTGGVLPFLISLVAGLSTIGALSGGAADITNAVGSAKDAKNG